MASKGLNKVNIIGYIGQTPEIRSTAAGQTIAALTIATSETWKDKQTGEKKEITEWHRIAIFGKSAEFVRDYINKGDLVFVDGQLKTRKYTDKIGAEKYITEIVVSVKGSIQKLSSGKSSQKISLENNVEKVEIEYNDEEPIVFDDEIPF